MSNSWEFHHWLSLGDRIQWNSESESVVKMQVSVTDNFAEGQGWAHLLVFSFGPSRIESPDCNVGESVCARRFQLAIFQKFDGRTLLFAWFERTLWSASRYWGNATHQHVRDSSFCWQRDILSRSWSCAGLSVHKIWKMCPKWKIALH